MQSSLSAATSSQQGSPRKEPRAQEKCESCRTRKVRCRPAVRQWDQSMKTKCDACIVRNKPCGPNTKVSRVRTTSANVPTTSIVPGTPATLIDEFPASNFADVSIDNILGDQHVTQPSIETPDDWDVAISPLQPLPQLQPMLDYQNYVTPNAPHYLDIDAWNQIQRQLSWMGRFAVLHEYCQHRANAIATIQEVWPLENFRDFIATLDVVIAVIGDRTLTSFRRIINLRKSTNTFCKELVGRRAFAIGRRFWRCEQMSKSGANETSSFHKELEELRWDLIAHYRAQKDFSEASRLHKSSQGAHVSSFGSDVEMLSTLAEEMNDTLQQIFKDLRPAYRNVLNPKGRLKITGAHLALVGGQAKEGEPEPSAWRPPDSVGIIGRNQLQLAVEVGDITHVRWLCENQLIDIEDRDTFGLTPLMVAVSVGNVAIFRYLLDHGANLRAQAWSTRSILSLASMAGHVKLVEEIFQRGFGIREFSDFCSPIHDAAASGRSSTVIDLLLENGAEPRDERPDHGGRCASLVASENQHEEISAKLHAAEQKLEQKFPTKDAAQAGKSIKKLKRLIGQETNTKSPDPLHSSHLTAGSSWSGSQSGRPSKRKRSVNQDSLSNHGSRSSAASPPLLTETTLGVPDTLTNAFRLSFENTPMMQHDDAMSPNNQCISLHELELPGFYSSGVK